MYERQKFYIIIYFFFNCSCRNKKNKHHKKQIRKVDNHVLHMYVFIYCLINHNTELRKIL